MKLYHGTFLEIQMPKIIEAKFTKDFGYGFYCTKYFQQAKRWAKRFDKAVVNTYIYKKNDELLIKEFKKMDDSWLNFVVDCRNGKPHQYDIVIGAMANDQIYNFVNDFVAGKITREQFWIMTKFNYPTHQINFCTQIALNTINFINSKIIKI